MEAGYMYLDLDYTGSSRRLIERSKASPAPDRETDQPRRSWAQHLFPQNTAAGHEVDMPPGGLFRGADSAQGSSTRSKSVYSQDDTRGSSIRSKSVYSQDDTSQAEVVASDRRPSGHHHQRNESLHVQLTEKDVIRMAGEIYDKSIPAVYLSLLGFWICENKDHYKMASAHIRELSLDQGYSASRIENVHLRELLVSTHSVRPPKAQERTPGKAAPVVDFEPHADENSFDVIYFAKLEVLPSSLRKKPESAVKEDLVARPLPSPVGDYPPNTPDRPNPLSLKSPHSGNAGATPTPTNRSVSTPLMNRNRRGTMQMPRHSVAFEEVTRELSRLTTATTASSRDSTDTDDVFGIKDKDFNRRSDPFDLMNALLALEGREPEPIDDDLDYHHNGYELASSDASSRIDHNTTYSPRSTSLQGPISEPSIIDSASTVKNPRSPTRYVYSSAPPSPAPAVAAPDPPMRSPRGKRELRQLTSRCAQSFLFGRRPNLATGDFYRQNLFPGTGRALIEVDNEDDSSPAPALPSGPAISSILPTFPLAPVINPVSTLPMLVAAATSPSTNPAGLAMQIRTALEATRARGNTLAPQNWKGMSCFEQAWRQANEELLIWVFGSQDTQLEPEDVVSVQAVARECRANAGHWVVEVLKEGAEIF